MATLSGLGRNSALGATLKVAGASDTLDIASPVTVLGAIDTGTAAALTLAATNATSVEIADAGVTTDIQGPITILGGIDTAGASALVLGAANATSVDIADAGVTTDIQGPITILGGIDTAAAATFTIGATNATDVTVGSASTPVLVPGSLTVDGILTVSGGTTSISSTDVLIADRHMLLNSNYTADAPVTAGIIVNYDPNPTGATEAVAATGFLSAASAVGTDCEVFVASTTGFSVGDFVLITGANTEDNNGIYEISLVNTNTSLEMAGVGTPTADTFTQTDFTDDTTVAGTIVATSISVIQAGTDGTWETASGATAGFTFTNLATVAGGTLQTAYDNGQSIAGSDPLDIDVTANITYDSTTGILIGNDVDTGPVSIGTGAAVVKHTLGNILSSESEINGVLVDLNSSGPMTLDSSGAGISLGAAGASDFTTSAGDLSLIATTNSVIIRGDESASDAILLDADGGAAGGITASAGTGGYSLGSSDTSAQTNTLFTGGTGIKTNTVGSTASTSTLTLQSGTGAMTFTAGGILAQDAVGEVQINSSGAAINIGDDAVAQAINIGTGAAARLITMGNVTGTTGVVINTGSGNCDVNAGGALTFNGGSGNSNFTSGADLTLAAGGVSSNLALAASNNISISNPAGGSITITAQGSMAISTSTGGFIVDSGQDSTINVSGDYTGLLDETQTADSGTAGNAYLFTSGIGAAGGGTTAGGIGGGTQLVAGVGGAGSATQLAGAGGDACLIAGAAGADGGGGAANHGRVCFTSGTTQYFLTAADTSAPPAILGLTATTIIEAINEIAETVGASAAEVVVTYTSGEALVTGDLVYISADNTVSIADATTAATSRIIGAVKAGVGSGVDVEIIICGVATLRSASESWVAGEEVYLADATDDGTVTRIGGSNFPTSGEYLQLCGFVNNDTSSTAPIVQLDFRDRILL